MADLIPFNSAEENNETSWYTAFGAGLVSGLIKVPEGIVSLGAELIDLGADTNTVASVEQFFDKINPFEEVAEERTIGKLSEALVQIGVPGSAGFKAASNLASKAIKAKQAGAYAKWGKNSRKALQEVEKLNKKAGSRKFIAGVMGGATGEAFVADADKIGSFGDLFGGPTSLDREESIGSDEASRRLLNRIKFGTESLLVTPAIYGVGKAAKGLAQRGKELAYSDSAFDRWVNKFIGAPFRPRGDLPQEVFNSEMVRQGLKAGDTEEAKQIVNTITKEVDSVFPEMQSTLNKSTKKERDTFLIKLNDALFEGDISKAINPKAIDDIVEQMDNVKLNPEARQRIVGGVNRARNEFTNLIGILNKYNPNNKEKIKSGVKNLQSILKDRISGWVGSTYRAFEPSTGILKVFQRYKPTDEAYNNAISLFRRYLSKTDPKRPKDTALDLDQTTDYYEQAKMMVDDILEQGQQGKKKAGILPDLAYQDKTAQGVKVKSFEKLLEKTGGKGSKVFRELFGEIQDPRYSIYNAMTNLSSVARTTAFFDDVFQTNKAVQAKGGRGAFWTSEAEAKKAVNFANTGVEIVEVGAELQKYKFPGLSYVDSSILKSYTTKEIAQGILASNDVPMGLAGFVRGRATASSAEKAASFLYRSLLLIPKGVSQLAKTVLSVPTHIRNFISAGAFSGANGILFEPEFYKKAFKEGIGTSGLLSARTLDQQAAYRELLELGVTNSQVQIGDLKGLFNTILKDGEQMFSPDTVLQSMMRKFKKLGSAFQGKYIAEDDTFKITNFYVELKRIRDATAKQLKIKPDQLDAALSPTQIKELKVRAANIVKNTVPNYSYVGSAVKTSRLLPIGNFMSFPSEMIRTTTGIAEQGISELRHSRPTRGPNITPTVTEILEDGTTRVVKNDNPMYSTGIKRISGMATTLTVVPATIVEGAKALYDVSEEEINALRQFVPKWSKNSTIVPIRDDEGELRYVDFSHSNAYDVIARPFRTLLNNVLAGQESGDILLRGFTNGVMEASGELMNPFISESIWTAAMSDLFVRNGRTDDGRLLYTDQTPVGDKLSIQFLHLGEALAPSYRQFQRLGQAAFGVPNKRGDELNIGPELAGFMGLRPIKIDPLKSMGFKIAEYQTGIRNARREFTGGAFGLLRGGTIKPNDVIERFYKSNQARFNVQKEMFKNLDAAATLGVEENDLRQTFKERQLSNDAFRKLEQGIFDPYFPSKDIQDRFREIADNLGDLDMFQEVAPVLREMQNDFREIELEDTFNLNLDEYLEDTGSIAESLGIGNIGQTPMPNQGVIQTSQLQGSGNTTSEGLTPTELALLSPEEQQIRLRQRGLA
mgnify:CR=1 FL=1|tara:strand:- start:857 stop:4861 length:4005 start_codon:yes stop_codon:yes gene_type:complete